MAIQASSWKILLPSCLAATFLLGMGFTPWRSADRDSFWRTQHDKIEDLQSLPLGKVQLEGVVTFADPSSRRFWIQDETGAVAIDGISRAVELGDLVDLQARKTRAYNPYLGLSSVSLCDVKIKVRKHRRQLPRPLAVTLNTLPEKENNGARVQLSAVVHQVTRGGSGLMELVLGDSGLELRAESREWKGDPNRWINARVLVRGVSETLRDPVGNLIDRYLWVASGDDLQVSCIAIRQGRMDIKFVFAAWLPPR